MVKQFSLSILLAFCAVFSVYSQHLPDYHPPLDIPLILASNFGELRPNHFHMGTDFKTNGVTGLKLYSIDEGYVSRIKVSAYGYGKVVYIDHPNGVTSVYAHCSKFLGEIDSITRHYQQLNKSYEVEIFPTKNEITLNKGEVFALSGNSGSSTAPHLHFELRDTESEAAINPLIYGFDIADHKAPLIRHVKLYAISKDGYRIPGKSKVVRVNFSNGQYYIANNTIVLPENFIPTNCTIGFAFDVIDRLDGANNKCGLYASYTLVNSDTIFGQRIDKIPFESTRFVNIHKDFEEYSTFSRKFHKSFKSPQNDLPIYLNSNDFHVPLNDKKDTLKILYLAQDAKGNLATLKFSIITESQNNTPYVWHQSGLLSPNFPKLLTKDSVRIEFPAGTVYEPINIDSNKISFKIGDPKTPVHKAYKVILKEDSTALTSKKFLEMKSNKNRTRRITGSYYKNQLVFSVKYFGTYSIQVDTLAPQISGQSVKTNGVLYRNRSIKWQITDSQTGINNYWLYINDKWVLLEYDYKTGYISYTNEGDFEGKCELKLIVEDHVGNQRIKKSIIYIK